MFIKAPATILINWLGELRVWGLGLQHLLIHKSASHGCIGSEELLCNLNTWLCRMRQNYINKMVDYDEDWGEYEFVRSGYMVGTSYEGVRRYVELWNAWDVFSQWIEMKGMDAVTADNNAVSVDDCDVSGGLLWD